MLAADPEGCECEIYQFFQCKTCFEQKLVKQIQTHDLGALFHLPLKPTGTTLQEGSATASASLLVLIECIHEGLIQDGFYFMLLDYTLFY